MKRDLKINLMFLVVPLALMLVVVIGVTYALFTEEIDTERTITVKTGDRYVGIYGEDKDNIELNNIYTFDIVNKGTVETGYEVYIESTTKIPLEKISFLISGDEVNEGTLDSNKVLVGNLDVGEEKTINIQLESAELARYIGEIKVRTSDYKVNEPVLVDGMIPVAFDGTNWIKVDSKNINNNWYDYADKNWANVVTIKDPAKREAYLNSDDKTVIENDDINAFFVWIPRFSYTLYADYGTQLDGGATASKETPGAFDIKFVNKDIIDDGKGIYDGITAEEYYTPVAFCFGDTCRTSRSDKTNIELPGIWVSKFELTGTDGDLSSLPNMESVRNIDISSMYNIINGNMNYESGLTNYGFDGIYNAHMIKNSEWSVVAYLSESKYGKYGNNKYDGTSKEIYQNKSDEFKTGCSYGSPSNKNNDYTCIGYGKKSDGVGASTTGTIYGIYDMSGGANEYVMSYLEPSILTEYDKSGFTNANLPLARFWDSYATTDAKSACNNAICRGENLIYTKGWYNDHYKFVENEYPWITRGGSYKEGEPAGIFSINRNDGGAYNDISTRVAIATY